MASKNVAILGASDRADRFAYLANLKLKAQGHTTYLVNPKIAEIEGQTVYPNLESLASALQNNPTGKTKVDTVTLYVNPRILSEQIDAIVRLNPQRVIFNPGTEDFQCETKLKAAGIDVVEACTLVMLDADRF